ncbi:MAG: DNA mismatch repair endonuclease MutL [Planctomycetota bacterium]|nr:DNA mismatch repair endonuclease MutL [Planctomycetota bacterium]
MARIRALEPHIVNQIAAGEVVERPASVVKELVENALDAGATRIQVRLEEGGRQLIEVSDDGSGMGADDLALAFHPHATSKVESVDDLLHIATMGFRGEALASIGSVARVRIVSRERGADVAHAVENADGQVSPVTPAAGSPGTVVRVETLFARVPARRKFLRRPATELGHINDLMARFALAFPHVGFRLTQGPRVLLECGADESRRERIARVHGNDIASALIHVENRDDQPEIEAYVGPPTLTRRDSRLEQVFLNGRYVRDRTIAHAIREAYRDILPPGGHRPIAFVFLACAPDQVDVNVHPAKAEVRWRDGQSAHRVVRRSLRRALEGVAPGVRVPVGTPGAGTPDPAAAVHFAFERATGRPAWSGGTSYVREAHRTPAAHAPEPAEAPTPAAEADAKAPALRPLAQALGTYLVLEAEDTLVLVDQHALHERVLFDQINDRLREQGNLEVQRLLVPAVVHVGAGAQAELLEARDLLQTLGWEVDAFGEDAVAVQGLPAVLRRPDPEAALTDVLEVLRRGQAKGLDRTALLSETVDRMACRGAVMAGDKLHPDEVLALLEQAEALNHSHSCPHGRPTRLTLTKADLERWFHRTV